MKNFNKQKNQLQNFILDESSKEYSKQTIIGLFRSILEPLVEAPAQEGLVLFRLLDTEGVSSIVKRLEFSSAEIYSFNDNLTSEKIKNIAANDLENIEFVLVLAPRYSAVMVWDYSLAQMKDFSEICLIFNSRTVGDVAKAIFTNSEIPLDEFLTKYAPDRRENELLNVALNKIVDCLNDVHEEIVINEAEKENLAKSEELLQEYEYSSDKAKFIAHEIKNNLSIIDLYSKISEKRINGLDIKPELKKSLENAVKSIQNATYSITQFVSQLKNAAKPILEERKLKQVIEDVVTLTAPRAKEQKITIKTTCSEDARVHVDEVKLQSVLINVIYNALDSTKKKGFVNVNYLGKKGNFAQVLISNNGEAIPKEIQERIFEKDFTTKLTGNGLGLFICKNLMKEQYGDINLVKSDENSTDFEILIPII